MEGLRQRIEKFCVCGGKSYTEAPPFEEMSDKDIENWRESGGRIMVLCKVCGREKITPESVCAELDKTIAVIEKLKVKTGGDEGLEGYNGAVGDVLKSLDSERGRK